MLKKTLTVLFFATIFAVGGLGIVTDTVAQDYSCTNFNIELIGVERVENYGNGNVFEYRYSVTGGSYPISKITLLEFGIEADLVVTETEKVKVFPPGQGGLGVADWLEGIPQLQVLSIASQEYTEANPLIILVAGTNGFSGTVAAHTMGGRWKDEACFIEGPVVSLVPVDASIPLTKEIVLNGPEGNVEYCIDIDPRTGCPPIDPKVYNCETKEPLPLDINFRLGDTGSEESPTFIGGDGEVCPIIKASHNPCQWILLSGRAYGPYCW